MHESFGWISIQVNRRGAAEPALSLTDGARFALSGVCRALSGRLDQRQFGRGNAGLQKSFTIKGDIRGKLPAEIPQVLFDGEAWIAGQQNLGRLRRLLSASQLR